MNIVFKGFEIFRILEVLLNLARNEKITEINKKEPNNYSVSSHNRGKIRDV